MVAKWNVDGVLKGSTSQCVPSVDVQTGVAGGASIRPTATKPPRQPTTDVTRLSGSSGARRRQVSPVQVADADADARGVVKATGRGTTSAEGAGLGTSRALVWSEAGGVVTSTARIWADGAGSTGPPHGFTMAMPTNPTSRTPTSAVTRRSRRPPVVGVPWNERSSPTQSSHPRARTIPDMVAAYRMRSDRGRDGLAAPPVRPSHETSRTRAQLQYSVLRYRRTTI